MKALLFQLDGRLPNLALMRLGAHLLAVAVSTSTVVERCGGYDRQQVKIDPKSVWVYELPRRGVEAVA